MILKNISQFSQLVNTTYGKQLIAPGEEFTSKKGDQLIRMYPEYFEEIKPQAKKAFQKVSAKEVKEDNFNDIE